jgi:hypothetical protein
MTITGSGPTVSVIIVSWNVRALLLECLRSLTDSRPAARALEIIVVDSHSADGTVEAVSQAYPDVVLLPQSENVGFARGNNIGLAAARGAHLLLLNPDTVVHDDAIERMAAYLDANPQVGIVGPHTRNADGSTQSTRRRFPTVMTAIFESTFLQNLAPHRVLRRYYVRDAADDQAVEVDWVQGSCMLVRRAVYEAIGGLDERYVMYSEELDWCRRAKAAGWAVHYLGQAHITHYGGQSSAQMPANSHIWFQRSKLRYFRRYHGWPAAQLIRIVLLLHYGILLAEDALKAALGHKRAMRQARMRTYWQVLRTGLSLP